MRRLAVVIAVLAAVSLLSPAFALGVAGQDDGGENFTVGPDNQTTPTPDPSTPTSTPTSTPEPAPSTDGWTLEELRRDGRQYSNSPASMRIADDRMVWLVHWPARSMWADVGNPMDQNWKYVGQDGNTVSGGAVYLRENVASQQSNQLELEVVSYNVDERTTTGPNGGTQTEKVPVNVSEKTAETTLQPGFGIAKVDLDSTTEKRQVLIYAPDNPDNLRWTFTHDPVATQQTAPISTEGDYLWQVLKDVILPTLGMLLVNGVILGKSIQRAGRGPGWGMAGWSIALTITAFLGFSFGPVNSVADILVRAPTILAVLISVIALIVFLEAYEVRTKTVQFIKPEPEKVKTASGEQGLDAITAASSSETVVEMPDGTPAVVRDGLLPFLARAIAGKAARVPKASMMRSSIELDGGDHDELLFVSPNFEPDGDDHGAIEFDSEGWEIRWPEYETRGEMFGGALLAIGMFAVGAAVWTSYGAMLGISASAAGFGLWLVRPTEGSADFELPAGHLRSAIITSMLMRTKISEAETLDEAREQNLALRAKNQKDIEEELDKQDSTLIESMLGDVDVERAISTVSEGSTLDIDDDVLEERRESADD